MYVVSINHSILQQSAEAESILLCGKIKVLVYVGYWRELE